MKKRGNKGITLIALVVTIIVLLLLAGISIMMLTGQNGILNQSTKARKESIIGSVKEAIELSRAGYVTDNFGEQPTARYIIEDIMGQDYIVADDVEDYGDYTGVGVIIVEDERIYINGALGDFDLMLRYELEPKIGYTIVRLYPKISTSDTYGDYAADILYGKSEEELEALLVEGWNYWWSDELYAESFDDIAQWFYDERRNEQGT